MESLSHVLKDCPNSICFWNDIVPPQCSLNSFNLPFIDWLSSNCTSSAIHPSSHIKWQIVFTFGLWNLWLRCNQLIFKPGASLSNLFASTISFASQPISIKWLLPPLGWAKLNTDGASLGNPCPASRGGVVQDCRGGLG
jgi:hypothetical protein